MGRIRMEDKRTEQLIQEHLIRGFSLLQNNPCPACRTPLVRQDQTETSKSDNWPIPGIAYCIKCDAHVVSHVSEVTLLEAYEKKQKNTSFYVAGQSTNNKTTRKQRSSKYVSSSEESSGILETSKESIADTQMAHAPDKTRRLKINDKKKVPTQPSVPGALIVDPIKEEEDPIVVQRRQQPVLVQPPPWWQTQWWTMQPTHIQPTTYPQRVLVETTSDGSANSGVRVQEGIVVSTKAPAEPTGFVVHGKDVVPTESLGPRDPPLEEARTENTSDAMSQRSNHDDSVNDPPSHLVVSVNSFQEEPAIEESKQKQSLEKQVISLNAASTQPTSNKADRDEIECQRETSSHQETPKHNNTIKRSLRKSTFRRRPKFLNSVNSTDDSIDQPHKQEKSHRGARVGSTDNSTQSEDKSIATENKDEYFTDETLNLPEREGAKHQADDVLSGGTLSLVDFVAAAPRVSMHPKETALTEQISGHNKDIVRESERVEHLEKMQQESIQKQVPVEIQSEIAKGIEDSKKARVKAVAKVQKLQQERSKVEAERILSFLEEELKEKQTEAIHAEKLAKDAYDRLTRARLEVAHGLTAESPRGDIPNTSEQNSSPQIETQSDRHIQGTAAESSTDPWEILRAEGRSALTRLLIAGWHVSLDQCKGTECQHFPLLSHEGQSYCAVCGGSGNGLDGAYDVNFQDESTQKPRKTGQDSVANGSAKTTTTGLASSVATKSLKAIQDEFDAKRHLASKEIGARMRQGWILLDMTCQSCMMPLLTDMSQECVLCVLCGIQSGLIKDESPTILYTEDEALRRDDVSDSGRCSGSPSTKHSHHDDLVSEDCLKHQRHDSSTAFVAPSHRRDPPPANSYAFPRRPLSPDGKRHDDYSVRSYGVQQKQSSDDVIVVEDADSLMSERRFKPHYAHSRRRYLRSDHQMKHFSPSWDSGQKDPGARRSSSPSYSVASAPQYGNPSMLVADHSRVGRNYVRNSYTDTSRFNPDIVSVRPSRRKDVWSDRSVGSSRSYHFRAPSPGLSAAVLPSAASSVYTGTSRTVKMTPRQHRIYPENWAGQATLGSSTRSRRSKRSEKSFRPIATTPSRHNSSTVIDVEPIRRWKEGREDVIIVGTKQEEKDEKGLEDLLLRIERTKAQIEERSQSPESRETQLKGLVDNLARSVQQLREIERR